MCKDKTKNINRTKTKRQVYIRPQRLNGLPSEGYREPRSLLKSPLWTLIRSSEQPRTVTRQLSRAALVQQHRSLHSGLPSNERNWEAEQPFPRTALCLDQCSVNTDRRLLTPTQPLPGVSQSQRHSQPESTRPNCQNSSQ